MVVRDHNVQVDDFRSAHFADEHSSRLNLEGAELAFGRGAERSITRLPSPSQALDFGQEDIYGKDDPNDKPPPTIVILDDGGMRFWQAGGQAKEVMEVDALFQRLVYKARVIDEPNSPKEIVDRLLEQAEKDGALGDIHIAGHGSPGRFYIGRQEYELDEPRVIREFSRLRGYMAPSSRLIFDGCNIGAGFFAEERVQNLANAIGAPVIAYEWTQFAGLGGIGPKVEMAPNSPTEKS